MEKETLDNTESNRCTTGYECPKCGENNIDNLELDADVETVFCVTCETEYKLPS